MLFTTKQGNTKKALKATLLINNQAENLSSVQSVRFIMRDRQTVKIDRHVEAIDAAAGIVWVTFEPEDVAEEGMFQAEFIVTYRDGREELFPDEGYIKIYIMKRLEGSA